jgi:hypothetical protein
LGGQQAKFDADLIRASIVLGTPSVHTVHEYYSFDLEDGGRLAPMADELVYRMSILVAARRFLGMGAYDYHFCAMAIMSVCSISFVELLMFLFGVFGGMCGENSCNVFLQLFMVILVPISLTLCKRAVLMLWHAFLFLGLRLFPLFFLFAWWSPLLFLVRQYTYTPPQKS